MYAKTIGAVAIATSLVLSGATPALAKGGRVERASGSCGSTTWKLKAKADNNRLEVEFEVDSNHPGQTWRVRLFDNGTRVFRGTRTTKAPSGSFSLQRRIANRRGSDRIVGKARNLANDKVCRGALTF